MIDEKLKKQIKRAQINEITEHYVYKNLAKIEKSSKNRELLEEIAKDELKHYNFLKELTEKEETPKKFIVFFYTNISRLFGRTFGLRLMEKGEELAQINYNEIAKISPKIKEIINDEEKHETYLIGLIDSKILGYVSSIVLGLNDALVELTGALAGFTLALKNPTIIAIAGLITGIAASLSMAASEYLSKQEEGDKNALRASIYTGMTYFITVLILITPFLLLKNPLISLAITLTFAIFIIFIFTFYVSIAKNISFKKKFTQMATISLGVAALNYLIGLLVNHFIGNPVL
ncbi:MAG: VIT1/CCC1 transporter family protein [Candidatus Gracilibacteria bacterium]|jgi:VIT1/CCC1 family predicted Fe2+/Mn2+ transporter